MEFIKIIFQYIFSQLELLPKEELIKFVKKQLALLKQTKVKCEGIVYDLKGKVLGSHVNFYLFFLSFNNYILTIGDG